MYGYYEHSDITPEHLLQVVDQTKIFEWVIGEPVVIGNLYKSPFREDHRPKCFFTQREDGIILFVDFGDRTGSTHRSCFKMVMDNYNPRLNLTQALNLICNKFELSRDSTDYKPIEYAKIKGKSYETVIEYIARDYESKDRKYWNTFLISIDNLKEDNVLAVSKFTKSNNKGVFSRHPSNICYAIDFISRVKIYMPKDSMKFVTNCNENDIGNIDNLPHWGDRLIITKSYKDHRVIRNVLGFHNVIWLMNEGCEPDEYILKNLLSRFKEVIIFFDNDYPGFRAAYKLYKTLISFSPSHKIFIRYIPIQYKPIKDAGEFVAKEGRQDTLRLLTKILKT